MLGFEMGHQLLQLLFSVLRNLKGDLQSELLRLVRRQPFLSIDKFSIRFRDPSWYIVLLREVEPSDRVQIGCIQLLGCLLSKNSKPPHMRQI